MEKNLPTSSACSSDLSLFVKVSANHRVLSDDYRVGKSYVRCKNLESKSIKNLLRPDHKGFRVFFPLSPLFSFKILFVPAAPCN